MFLARSCPALQPESRRALLRELKGGLNMALYSEILGEKEAREQAGFIDGVKHNAAQQHDRLEQELNSYKSTMIKESIRVRKTNIISGRKEWRMLTFSCDCCYYYLDGA